LAHFLLCNGFGLFAVFIYKCYTLQFSDFVDWIMLADSLKIGFEYD